MNRYVTAPIRHFLPKATVKLRLFLLISCVLLTGNATAARLDTIVPANDPPQSFRVLCYHDIRDNLRESFKTWPEPAALDTQDLIRHFSWLDQNGYHPVSLQQIIDARAGRSTLPDKAILLTFDDGYKSVYTKVFPLLKQFHFPALIAVVGDWIQTPPDTPVNYGGKPMPRHEFANWDDVREMVASGLVEVASHSHNMHKGIQTNPQGSSLPAAVSRFYWPQKPGYEGDEAYAARIKDDLKRGADLIEREIHIRPQAMVWPYGAYNMAAAQWSAEAGMPVTMNLEPGPNTPAESLLQMRRSLMMFNTDVADLIRILREPSRYDGMQDPLERVIHVRLDDVYDPNPEKQEQNVSALLDRMQRLHPTTIYLQAYSDPRGDGVAEAVYFPNRHLPMRTDLFSRVAWQLSNRLELKVYAWMPVMAFKLPASDPAAMRTVQSLPGTFSTSEQRYAHRLSLFDPLVRQTITEIYEDLGKHAVFDGVLFHSDAMLSDDEDASPGALAVYHDQWQLPASLETVRQDPVLRRRWTEKKIAYINDFTLALANTLRQYQPALFTVRHLYAQTVLNPEKEEQFAQSLPSFLAAYDFTAIMAMPAAENKGNASHWISQLVQKVNTVPGALRATVFDLQRHDPKTGQSISAETLAEQLRQLRLAGVRNLGYYSDNFNKNQPDEAIIKPEISVESHPVRR